jgi:predicted lipid-binding transport protein (Tim44 family)
MNRAALVHYYHLVPEGAWIAAAAILIVLVVFLLLRGLGESAPTSVAAEGPRCQELILTAADFERFQLLAQALNHIWRTEDVESLSQIATDEMAARLADRRRAASAAPTPSNWMVHELQVLKSDTLHAWREDSGDVAQVNLRLSTLESSGEETPRRFVSREVWSFVRPRGGAWLISGVRPVE